MSAEVSRFAGRSIADLLDEIEEESAEQGEASEQPSKHETESAAVISFPNPENSSSHDPQPIALRKSVRVPDKEKNLAAAARAAAYQRLLLANRRKSHVPLLTAQLGAAASLLFKGIGHSIALFTMAESGTGKSEEMKAWTGSPAHPQVVRADKFTLAGLNPSGFRDEKGTNMEKSALYLAIKHKVMVTPELGRIFRGRTRGVLEERFADIAGFLDAEGIKSWTGTHGQQGEEGDYSAIWLGNTTPWKIELWETAGIVGLRCLMFPLGRLPKEDQLPGNECDAAVEAIRSATRDVLDLLFSQHDPRTVEWTPPPPAMEREIDRLTELLGAAHMVPGREDDAPSRPDAMHLNSRLKEVLAGVAWVTGRQEPDESDLHKIVRPIVSRSAPQARGRVLLALRRLLQGQGHLRPLARSLAVNRSSYVEQAEAFGGRPNGGRELGRTPRRPPFRLLVLLGLAESPHRGSGLWGGVMGAVDWHGTCPKHLRSEPRRTVGEIMLRCTQASLTNKSNARHTASLFRRFAKQLETDGSWRLDTDLIFVPGRGGVSGLTGDASRQR
jgi:hypothetical protein